MTLRTTCLLGFLVLAAACGGSVSAQSGQGGGGGGTSTGTGTSTTSGTTGTTTGTGGTDFGACDPMTECVLAFPGCCGGTCGAPTLAETTPIAASAVEAYFDATCPDPGGTPCPGCASFPNGNLYAYCDAGHCQEGDVSKSDLAACVQASDCTLRFGSGCCEMCGGTYEPGYGGDLIAINASKIPELLALVCVGDVGCPNCLPAYPPGAYADCVGGLCVVAQAQP